jgi:hypothetical protein
VKHFQELDREIIWRVLAVVMILVIAFNFFLCYEINEAWKRNKRLFNVNSELYRDGVHKNDHIDRLEREARDKSDLCNRILVDKGGIVFMAPDKVGH